jgi:hypothetical protein
MKNLRDRNSILNRGIELKNMGKPIDVLPLGLMLIGAYLLSQGNSYGWLPVILGVYVLLRK